MAQPSPEFISPTFRLDQPPQLPPQARQPEDYDFILPIEEKTYWDAHRDALLWASDYLCQDPNLWATIASDGDNNTTVNGHSVIGTTQILLHQERNHDDTRVARAEDAYVRTHDHKTGLLNEEGLELEIAAINDRSKYIFVYGDATNFRAVDKLLGEEKVNTLFREMAEVMRCILRENDIIARLYGDTFVALAYIGDSGNDRRNGNLAVTEKSQVIRKRVDMTMNDVFSRHPDAQKLGFHFAVGATEFLNGLNLQQLIDAGKADMKQHKDEQHARLGSYRTEPELE